MSDEELKPCPFCGMDWLEVHVKGSERGPAYQVVCSECGASGPVAEREREVAMTAWNTHHTTFDPPYGKPHNQQTYGKPHSAPPSQREDLGVWVKTLADDHAKGSTYKADLPAPPHGEG